MTGGGVRAVQYPMTLHKQLRDARVTQRIGGQPSTRRVLGNMPNRRERPLALAPGDGRQPWTG